MTALPGASSSPPSGPPIPFAAPGFESAPRPPAGSVELRAEEAPAAGGQCSARAVEGDDGRSAQVPDRFNEHTALWAAAARAGDVAQLDDLRSGSPDWWPGCWTAAAIAAADAHRGDVLRHLCAWFELGASPHPRFAAQYPDSMPRDFPTAVDQAVTACAAASKLWVLDWAAASSYRAKLGAAACLGLVAPQVNEPALMAASRLGLVVWDATVAHIAAAGDARAAFRAEHDLRPLKADALQAGLAGAIQAGHAELAAWLLNEGATPSADSMIAAAARLDEELARRVLRAGAPIDAGVCRRLASAWQIEQLQFVHRNRLHHPDADWHDLAVLLCTGGPHADRVQLFRIAVSRGWVRNIAATECRLGLQPPGVDQQYSSSALRGRCSACGHECPACG